MKHRKLFQIAFFIIVIGWFPFMWISVWVKWNPDYAVAVLCTGILICMIGSVLCIYYSNKRWWKSQEKLDEEIEEWKKARELYEKAKDKLERFVLSNKTE